MGMGDFYLFHLIGKADQLFSHPQKLSSPAEICSISSLASDRVLTIQLGPFFCYEHLISACEEIHPRDVAGFQWSSVLDRNDLVDQQVA